MITEFSIKMTELESKIYDLVKKIPRGRVTTYGKIAAKLLTGPRVVGNALHKNPFPGIVPCHRVVNREGKLAVNFGFGGAEAQEKMLKSEGIILSNNRVPTKYFDDSLFSNNTQ